MAKTKRSSDRYEDPNWSEVEESITLLIKSKSVLKNGTLFPGASSQSMYKRASYQRYCDLSVAYLKYHNQKETLDASVKKELDSAFKAAFDLNAGKYANSVGFSIGENFGKEWNKILSHLDLSESSKWDTANVNYKKHFNLVLQEPQQAKDTNPKKNKLSLLGFLGCCMTAPKVREDESQAQARKLTM